MKINNPTKFFPEKSTDLTYNFSKNRSTIMTRGDVIRKFAPFDSSQETDWHVVENSETDSWVKFSFDGGFSYPLKFRYKNTHILKFFKDGRATIGTVLAFDFSSYSALDYSSIRNGKISLYAINDDGYFTNIPCYRYKFDDSSKELNIVVAIDSPDDTEQTMLLIELDGNTAMAMAVPTPVFSSFVSFTPMEYTPENGNHGELGNDNRSITLTTNLDNVGKLALKLSSFSNSEEGNVVLQFDCGSDTFTQTVRVTPTSTWQEIVLSQKLTGALTITRLVDDANDTLTSDCIISNVKIEIFN